MPSSGERVKARLRRLPGWGALVLARSLASRGERRESAVALILRPGNLFQPYTTTAPDRYPQELAVLEAAMTTKEPRILSFGCASGDELLSLWRHFPRATIHGIDINPLAVRAARKKVRAAGAAGAVTVSRGSDAAAQPPGSCDVVLALAVFRHGSLKDAPARCDAVLRFADFERTVTGLSDCLRPGGLLVIRHANFRFTDCGVARGYEPVLTGFASRNAVESTPVYGPDNRLLPDELRDDGVYRKVAVAT